MPSRAHKRVIRRGVLERAAHGLLARYLAPFAPYLEAHGVSLAALGESPQDDRALPRALDSIFHDSGANAAPPSELLERLIALDALATPDGAMELVRLDKDKKLPRGTHGDEDLALVALLDHAELAASAKVAASRETETKFVEYAPAAGMRPRSLDDAAVAALRELLGAELDALDHTAYCDVTLAAQGDELLLEIDHGSRPQTRDRVDPKSLRVAQVTDVTARRAYARYHGVSGRLCVRALPRVRQIIVRAFGHVLAGDPEAFRAEGLYDLSPFLDLETALAVEGVTRLVKVELHCLTVATADGLAVAFSRPRKDALASTGRGVLEAALAAGDPVSVRVYLHVLGRSRPIRLELAADGKNNSVDFDRDDDEVALVVNGYMRARGILCSVVGDDAAALATEGALA
jgi:hypothetical protein